MSSKAHGPGGILDYLRTTNEVIPNALPDLVLMDMDEVDDAMALGVLRPLDSLLLAGISGDLYPFATEFSVLDGQRLALPYEVNVRLLVYDGKAVPSVPISWTEPLTLAEPYLVPLSGESADVTDGILLQYAALAGWGLGPQKSVSVDELTLATVFGLYKSLQASAVLSTASLTTTTLAECWKLFVDDKTSICEAMAQQYLQAPDGGAAQSLAIAPIPTLANGEFAIGHGWAWVVTSVDPRRQQGAMALLSWLLEKQNLSTRCAASGYLPTLKSATIGSADAAEPAALLRTLLERTYIAPLDGGYAALREWLRLGLQEVLAGSESPEQAAAEVSERVQTLSAQSP